jgi:phosphatidylglycerol lysyltransferase
VSIDPKPSQNEPDAPSRLATRFGMLMRVWRIAEAPFKIFFGHPVISTTASLIIFLIALKVINVELTKYSLEDLQSAFADIGPWTLGAAIVSASLCYGALAINDQFALSMVGKRLPYARTVRASIAASALANTLGYSWATAGTARRRLYRKWGLLPNEVGAMSFVSGTAVQIGGLAAAGLGLVVAGSEVALHGPLNSLFWYGTGVCVLVPAGLWLAYARSGPAKADFAGAIMRRPPTSRGFAHLSVVMLEWMCAAGVLYILLPTHGGWSFPAFLAVYVLAGMLGAISGAPGGIGVFEAIILTLAPVSQDTPGAAVALLIYRLIYNIIPLCIGLVILALDQAAPVARPAARAARRLGSKVTSHLSESVEVFAPQFCAIMVFVAGLGMLGSIATPAFTARLALLSSFGLSELAETTHVSAGIIGTLLLFLAAGVAQRLALAWTLSSILVGLGGLISLSKGLEWEQGILLGLVLIILLALRDGFKITVLNRRRILTPGWTGLILGGLATTIWIANFAYQHLPWRWDVVLDFARNNDVGRSQRAIIAVILTATLSLLSIRLLADRSRETADPIEP